MTIGIPSVTKSRLSIEIEEILGHECKHNNWELDYYGNFDFHADCFANRKLPILNIFDPVLSGLPISKIKLLPNPKMQKTVLLSIGNPENKLKWLPEVILTVLVKDLNFQLQDQSKLIKWDEYEWQEWWKLHQKYFEIVKNEQKAVELVNEYAIYLEKT